MEAVRPFLLGQVFSYTFKLIGKDFWKMFFTVVICMLILLIPVAVFIAGIFFNPAMIADFANRSNLSLNPMAIFSFPQIWVMTGALMVLSLLIMPFMSGVLLYFSSSRLQGRPLSMKQAYSFAARKYGHLLLTMFCGVVIAAPFVALYLYVYFNFMGSVMGMTYSLDGNMENFRQMFAMMPLFQFVNLLYSAAMILIGIANSFALAVTINEDRFAFAAVFKGFKLLFKGGFWRNIGHYLMMALTIAGFGLAFGLIIMVAAIPLAFASMIAPFLITLMVLLILAFSGFTMSFETTYMQLMYFNARLKNEGVMF